jgi:hypothetical protein
VIACIAAILAASGLVSGARQAVATINVRAGENLQAALDRAQPGDTLLLEAGATFVGNFVLPVKDGASYITVRSSVPDNQAPPPGERIRPAHAPLLATLRSPNSLPVLQTAHGAHHWRLVLLEIGPNATPTGDLIRLGDSSARQTRLEGVPHDLEIDRCYIHGDPLLGQKRGIALNSGSTRITNSYFADFKLRGQDTQAIAGWNGPGPYLIENNYLEAAGENVLFGGADPAIPGLVPADIVFRENHVSKPVSWRREQWEVKNLFELKNATRVLIEHNLFEHNWQAAQAGPAILFTVRNQDGASPWSVVSHVMFRANVVRHVAAAFNIVGYDNNHPSQQTSHISIHHNLVTEVDAARWGGNGVFLLIGDAARAIHVDHNTVMHSGNVVSAHGRPTAGFVFTNNVIRHNAFGIKGDARATGRDTLTAFFPGAIVTGNVFAEGPATQYPPGNLFPSHAVWIAQFRDYFGGDYELTTTSMYRSAGTDGADLGADLTLLERAFAAPSGRIGEGRARLR